ncbi:MAG TPA: DUF2314 domain-containing protein [Pyrinomonadaceae bacterium]|nr:DUF2314 domain-containing protein [Pyrinomonadaceae bacterium]
MAIAQQPPQQQPTPSPKQEVYLAPNAPKDKPVDAKGSEAEQLEEAIKPYIEKAKNTYPQAKARFLSGLPPKHTFFITTRLHDSSNRWEQVFIAVRQIKDGQVTGVIASNVHLVSGFREGDTYKFPESDMVDWTISKPDGTEEGNFVGNFIDTYQVTPSTAGGVWKNQPVTPARMNQRIEEAAVQYAAHAPIPRIVLYDIGFPLDEKEAAALDGHGVILLTSVSQVREELPLQRVYVLSEGKEVELKLLKVVLAELNTPEAASAKTFGKFRADALYLLPLSLRVKNVDLLVDFQTNRSAFKVAAFGTPLPDDLKALVAVKSSGAGPSQAALETFVKREYPSFVDQ